MALSEKRVPMGTPKSMGSSWFIIIFPIQIAIPRGIPPLPLPDSRAPRAPRHSPHRRPVEVWRGGIQKWDVMGYYNLKDSSTWMFCLIFFWMILGWFWRFRPWEGPGFHRNLENVEPNSQLTTGFMLDGRYRSIMIYHDRSSFGHISRCLRGLGMKHGCKNHWKTLEKMVISIVGELYQVISHHLDPH